MATPDTAATDRTPVSLVGRAACCNFAVQRAQDAEVQAGDTWEEDTLEEAGDTLEEAVDTPEEEAGDTWGEIPWRQGWGLCHGHWYYWSLLEAWTAMLCIVL